MKTGKFITLYGINNIGKSTHAKILTERLQKEGYDAVYLKYPIYDLEPTGSQINEILRGQSKQLVSEEDLQTLFRQNRQDFEPQLKAMLDAGKIIIAEDYTGTGIAWGAAKGASMDWLEELNRDLLHEDFALLLRGERNIKAREKNHIHEQNDALVVKVGETLLALGEKYGWQQIQVQPTKEATAELIWKIVQTYLKR